MPVLQIVRKHEQESPFLCSACGADRGCECTAPALRRTSADTIADRERKQRQREKAKQNQSSVPTGQDIDNTEEYPPGYQSPWTAHGKPLPEDSMPTQEEADKSYQQTIYDHVCQSVDTEMSGEPRQRFFAHLRRKYHVNYSQSDTQSGDKGLPA